MREMRDKLRPSEFRKIQVVPLSLLGARLLSRTTSTMDYRGRRKGGGSGAGVGEGAEARAEK